MADNKQSNFESKTILTSAGGNIEASKTIGGANLTFTHPSGSNIQLGNSTTSTFNSGNEQKLTLSDSFTTTYGDNSDYTRGTKEFRIEGDSVEFIGPTALLTNNVMDRWYKTYGEGYGSLKSQWDDNRFDFSPNEYPVNTVYSVPSGMENITVCPELKDGTAENNKNAETKAEFEKSMMDSEEIKNSDATKALQQQLSQTYSDFNSNAQSLYQSKFGK